MSRRILILAGIAVLSAGAAHAATLKVQVHDVAGAKGEVLAALCDEKSFLGNCVRKATAKAARGAVTLTFENVPAGRWAVMVFHDEDGDRMLGRSALGIPTEGTGFSRDASSRNGPPSFADAALTIGAADAAADINLTYY